MPQNYGSSIYATSRLTTLISNAHVLFEHGIIQIQIDYTVIYRCIK